MILRIQKTMTLALLCVSLKLLGQHPQQPFELSLNDAFGINSVKKTKIFAPETTTEVGMAFMGMFKFYKNVFSSQDSKKCNFHPSCSEYGALAINKYGIFGVFHTMDRLTRCNGLNANQYPYLSKRKVLFDPISPDNKYFNQIGNVIVE